MSEYRARVVVPTTAESAETVVTQIQRDASQNFGGYSQYDGHGGWVAPNNELIEEEHTVIEVVADCSRDALQDWLHSVADTIKTELDETEVLVTVEELDAQFL